MGFSLLDEAWGNQPVHTFGAPKPADENTYGPGNTTDVHPHIEAPHSTAVFTPAPALPFVRLMGMAEEFVGELPFPRSTFGAIFLGIAIVLLVHVAVKLGQVHMLLTSVLARLP